MINRNSSNKATPRRGHWHMALLAMLAASAIGPASAQAPFTGTDDQNLPRGDRLNSVYRPGQGQLPVPAARGPSAEALLGFQAAAAGQSQMPAGITLGRASTSRVMVRPPAPADTAALAASAGGAVDAQEKLITLFPLEYRGVPLSKGSDYLVVVNAANGSVLQTRERSIPTEVDATTPTVSAEAAVVAAKSAAGAAFASAVADTPRLEIWVDADNKGHLAWTLSLDTRTPAQPRVRAYWIAAIGDARTLHWESAVFHTHFGIGSGNVWGGSPFQPTINRPLAALTIGRSDGASAVTGLDGRFGFASGVGSVILSATLRGPAFTTVNQGGSNLSRSVTATPNTAADLNFGASGDLELAQATAFYWANEARRVAGILSPAELAALPVNVNINSSCNAYWDGSSINFFRAGGSCPNTAYADVVLHEYGHGVDAAKGGILDGGYSEGFGDALAVLGTRQPCLGRDFLGSGTCLRPATDLVMWPPAAGEEVHAVGRRYAGFTWELVQQLKKTYADDEAFALATRLVMAAAAANPSNIPDAVRLSFVADDTDGNLATCSPHFKELAAAADSRNIPRPASCATPGTVGATVTSDAQFPWLPAMTVSTNSNIASATITLAQASRVHIVASTSARAVGANAVQFSTGFFNQPVVNVMWTNSLRAVTANVGRNWSHFGSTFAVTLPAGVHQISWKLWTTAPVELSGGTLLVQAYPLNALAASARAESAEGAAGVSRIDQRGRISSGR